MDFMPPPEHQKRITWRDVPNAFAYVLVYSFMAYLVRRRNTQVARLLLLPDMIYLVIRGTFYYDFYHPDYIFHNWCRGKTQVVLRSRVDFTRHTMQDSLAFRSWRRA